MWAYCNTERGKLQLKKVPTPKPGKGQVLVKVKYASVNPSDIYMMAGLYD